MNPLSSLKRLLGVDSDDAAEDASRPRSLAAKFVAAHPDADLDYSPSSLYALDEIAADVDAEDAESSPRTAESVDANATDGTSPNPATDAATAGAADADEAGTDAADADVEATNETVRRMGAYLGETFVRSYDGEWTFDEHAGWVVELPATHRGQPLVLTIPSVLGDVVTGESSFVTVHDLFASELDVETPELAEDDGPGEVADPREEPSPADVVAAFDRVASELAAEHDALDFTPNSLGALDDVAREDREDREADVAPFDPETDELDLSVGGRTDAVAGYFAAVLRTHHDAAYRGELAETVVVQGPTRTARLEPRTLAAAVAAGETSFAVVYADLREDLGLGDV